MAGGRQCLACRLLGIQALEDDTTMISAHELAALLVLQSGGEAAWLNADDLTTLERHKLIVRGTRERHMARLSQAGNEWLAAVLHARQGPGEH